MTRGLRWTCLGLGALGIALAAVGTVLGLAQPAPATSPASVPASGTSIDEQCTDSPAEGAPLVEGCSTLGESGVRLGEDDGAEGEGEAGDTAISSLAAAWWVSETATRLDIPERALAAYAGAAIRLQGEQPTCGLDWATLAGIGHVESGHGTIHGGALDRYGQQVPAVFGIALDGTSTDAIGDTDGGALDGDPVWDRAMGPMQIIPETWQQFGADGNGDGVADPQQVDDAALTAARYLCAEGAELRSDAGWISAVAAYNSTLDYNHRVADATSYYRG